MASEKPAPARCLASISRKWLGRWILLLVSATLLSLPQPVVGQSRDTSFLLPLTVREGWDSSDNVQYAFTPNDPYYATGNPAGFPGQWHLDTQTSGAVYDANIVGAWNRDLTGQGVTIGIVDDGLQIAHPDLSPNYVAADSYDFGQNDAIPNPVYSNSTLGDNHGTAVAGVAAARGGNAIGGTGAAPQAGLAGLRIDFLNQTSAMFANATLYHSSGANTNIKVKNHSYGVSIPFISENLEANALVTSHNAGTIHVFAAGNERAFHGGYYFDVNSNNVFDPDIDTAIDGDANKKHLPSLQETIDVAALASSGIYADYSNWGANVWVTAPSSSSRASELAITTTDRTGGFTTTGGYNYTAGGGDGDSFPDLDYASTFGGTSSASPLVAGVMALGKQAQPNLDTRFAKHLLARTSVVIDPLDATLTGGWVTNGAGYHFNENYGFGLIDADAFTTQAALYSGVTPLTTETISFQTLNQAIPDADLGGISDTFTLTGQDPLEEVEIHLDVSHTWRGDVEAFLQSPSGTVSRLMLYNPVDSFNTIDWTLLSNAFWGEIPAGTWTLTVRDVITQETGTWVGYDVLAKMGTLIPEPSSLALALLGLLAFLQVGRRHGQI